MSWNYRVMRYYGIDNISRFGVFEVYYENDKVKSWTEGEVTVSVENTYANLIAELECIQKAFTKPILDHKTGLEI